MATKRPAKLAIRKADKGKTQNCPLCETEMNIAKIFRVAEPSGIFWLCSNSSCAAVVSKTGMLSGQLGLR